jgi:hypothetical protein
MKKKKILKLPVRYDNLSIEEKKIVREKYIIIQKYKCYYCHSYIYHDAPDFIKEKRIDWELFPPNFLKYPIHLQHDHNTGLTEGAVHNYCNAVMWQYEGR